MRQLRDSVATAKKEYDKTEDDLKALQSVGQIIGEVLRQLDAERCKLLLSYRSARQFALTRHPRNGSNTVVSPYTLLAFEIMRLPSLNTGAFLPFSAESHRIGYIQMHTLWL